MEREADLQEYAELILSTKAFASLLSAGGHTDSQAHERAGRFLNIQDHAPHIEDDPLLLEHRIYLDDLTVGYLQTAGFCKRPAVVTSISGTPSMKDEQAALMRPIVR